MNIPEDMHSDSNTCLLLTKTKDLYKVQESSIRN
jgi:hypothetical protein